jgi:hypothetical protein
MEDLRNVMQVIDQNSHNISEGDYLKLCNIMRKIYRDKSRQDMKTIVDYENFDVFVEDQSDQVLDHFHDHFYNISIMNEESFFRAQIEYLQNELDYHKPIKRITKYVKYSAIREYCHIHGIVLEVYDEDHLRRKMDEGGYDLGDVGTKFDRGVKRLYKSYIALENTYREMYRAGLNRKIRKIWGWIDNLEEM